MGQSKLGTVLQGNNVDGHDTLIFRRTGDSPREDKSPRSVNLAVLPNMVDFLVLTTHYEGERTAYARVERNAHHFLFAEGRAEHPFADHFGIEPGIENTLR